MRHSLILIVALLFNISAWAETSRSAFEAIDVPTALRQVFGRSDYLATDKIKIMAGNLGRTSSISRGFEGETGQVSLSFDLPGPRKIAILMEPLRVPRGASAPLLAIYRLSNLSNDLMVPLRFPYFETRITVVVEVEGKLWGAQETFRANLNRGSDAGREPCDDKPRDKLARFTGPLLDNTASVLYSTKTSVPLILVTLEQEMSWTPVLHQNCTLSQPRAIRSAQLAYDGTAVAEMEWGSGIAQPTIMVSMPTAKVGAPLTLRWQDTRGHHYAYASTVPEKYQSAITSLHTASLEGDLKTVQHRCGGECDTPQWLDGTRLRGLEKPCRHRCPPFEARGRYEYPFSVWRHWAYVGCVYGARGAIYNATCARRRCDGAGYVWQQPIRARDPGCKRPDG